jgi:hypothetical protein
MRDGLNDNYYTNNVYCGYVATSSVSTLPADCSADVKGMTPVHPKSIAKSGCVKGQKYLSTEVLQYLVQQGWTNSEVSS